MLRRGNSKGVGRREMEQIYEGELREQKEKKFRRLAEQRSGTVIKQTER